MVKLVELFGTKYIYKTYNQKLTQFIIANPSETIDLAGARITKDCMATIMQVGMGSRRCTFIDSEDAERNKILEYNQQQAAANAAIDKSALRKLPIPSTVEDVAMYLKYDYGDAYYTVGRVTPQAKLWAVLLQTRRPDVKMYTVGQLDYYLPIVCKYYKSRRNLGKPVIYIGGQNCLMHCDCADAALLDAYDCVSTDFGQVNLWEREEWRPALEAMYRDYLNYITPKAHHIRDYI